MNKNEYSVLLVEDDSITRSRFSRLIQEHPLLSLNYAAENYSMAKVYLTHHEPDVLIVDLGLPDGFGVDLIRFLRHKKYQTESMVITIFSDERNVLNAIEAGASGYLLKDESDHDLANSIFQMLHGGSPISPTIARHLLKRFRPPTLDPTLPALTKKETEVLRYIAKGYCFSEIAEMLFVSKHTIKSHVKNIYRKLQVGSRSEAVFEALQNGLIDLHD